VLFAGDSAHGVSPFGARGANSGVQDAENLAWKLAYVLQGHAPDALLDTYASEREFAADENLRNSTRSTDFITPKSPASRVFRDAVLKLARHHPFARQLVNSGRLSVPAVLHDSPLNSACADAFAGAMVPGAACVDAPVAGGNGAGWLLGQLGPDFTLLVFGGPETIDAATRQALAASPVPVGVVHVSPVAAPGMLHDLEGLAARRYDARPGTCYLIRPDQHVCARWRAASAPAIGGALARSLTGGASPGTGAASQQHATALAA
jgi:3-(3-hydroxy-phenyl)propionate hydroxylase